MTTGSFPKELRLSNMQTKEPKDKKVRVFALAKELNLESKVLVDLCKELGFAGITNQLNGLDPDQIDHLKDRIKKGPKATAPGGVAAPRPAAASGLPKIEAKILTIPKAKTPPPRTPVDDTPVTEETPEPEPLLVEPAAVVEPEPQPAPAPSVPLVPEAAATVAVPVSPVPVAPQNFIPSFGGGRMADLNRRPQALGSNRPPAAVAHPTPPAAPAPKQAPVASTPPVATPTPAPPAPVAPTPPEAVATKPVAAPSPVAPVASVPPAMRPPAPANLPSRPAVPPSSAGTTSGISNAPSRPNVLNRPPQVPPPRPGVTAPPRNTVNTGNPSRPPGGGPSGGPGGGPPRPGGGPRPPGPSKPPGPGSSVKLTPEMIDRLRRASQSGQKMTLDQITKAPPPSGDPARGPAAPGSPARPGGPAPAARPAIGFGRPSSTGPEAEAEEDDKKKGPGRVIGSDSRSKGRNDRGRSRSPVIDRGAVVITADGTVETVDSQFGSRKGPRQALLNKLKRRQQLLTVKKEGRIEISPPINVRSLSEAIGMKAGELSKRLLKETEKLYGINSPIEFEFAALIAAEKNIELVLKLQETAEDKLLKKFEELMTNVDLDKLSPRPPIVTIMGHVDHGKTSLLDKIRSSKVVDTEIGGITQVIRAWSVVHKIDDPHHPGEKLIERPITFLDTPGHEAFTKMRARGAMVTDIAVIVVAATDGVMPQTEEAIAHARAADVRIIIAINKVDMPNANLDRTRRQLYSLNLLPDDMGGDTQFVETSAATGQGIDDLLTAILLESELNLADELRADPDRPATGTCLEAYMSADEGVMATVLVQQGTLKRGDIVLCGSTFGRVRAMYSDLGKPSDEAHPSTPVRITGLNEVPNADDPFYVVEELSTAQEIAEVRRQKDREAQLNKFAPVSLESITAAKSKIKISELKVILKAEARGSVEAIRKELEKLTHEEVRTRVLHAGIGAITESDMQLALTSPDDTLVIGFNVTADDAALRLAEERGLPTPREYNIIYNLVDDVKAALEGRLKPILEVLHLGRAVVRETFKISKTGTIAGCYVTSGTIERSSNVRLIRDGIVVFPHGEKEAKLDSLKRFKDDVRDVREGFECGMKIAGYDDIKVGDVIEAYKIESRQRTL